MSAGARRQSIKNLPPDRSINNRHQTNSSASSSKSGSLFDIDITTRPQSAPSPLTPFPSPPGSCNGVQIPPSVQREYTFVNENLLVTKGGPSKNRKYSLGSQNPVPCKKKHSSRKSESSLHASKLPQDLLPDYKLPPPLIDVPTTEGTFAPKSTTRPQLVPDLHTTSVKSHQSDLASADDADVKQPLCNTEPAYHSPAATRPGSTDATAIEILDSENEKPLITNNKPKQTRARQLKLSQYGSEIDIYTLNYNICSYILEKRKKSPDFRYEDGYVYIFESPDNAPNHVKIGYSKYNPEERKNKIQRDCKITLGIVKQEKTGALPHYRYLEKILHKALHPYRKQYKCNNCNKGKACTHEEYFEIPHEKALEQVKLWTDWFRKQKPFQDDGTLTDYWYWRTKKLKASLDLDIVRWEDWTQPVGLKRLSYVDFKIEMWQKDHWIYLKKHMGRKDIWFWQMGTIFSLLLCMRSGWEMCLFIFVLCIL